MYPNAKESTVLGALLSTLARDLAAINAERDSWVKAALVLELAEVKNPKAGDARSIPPPEPQDAGGDNRLGKCFA